MEEQEPIISTPSPKPTKVTPWITAIFMVVGCAVLAAMFWNENVRVGNVHVKGNYFSNAEEIISVAKIPDGVKPDSLDLAGIQANIDKLNYIKRSSIFVEPNGKISITVEERTPIAMLIEGSKRTYVDEDGVQLNQIKDKHVDVPLLYGFKISSPNNVINSKAFAEVRDFLLAAKADEFGWITISEVAYSSDEGVVALSSENGVKLIFGTSDYATKLENWKAFYTEVLREKGIGSMNQVDLRFTNQIVTRET